MLARLESRGFDMLTRNHAAAILSVDFPEVMADFVLALCDFRLPVSELIGSGGGEAPSTQRLRRTMSDAGWTKHNFVIETRIDDETRESVSHEIDHVRRTDQGTLALEIEWNNKDPFFDRDLENFQRLHAQGVISVGIIVTRGRSLQAGLSRTISGYLARAGFRDPDDLAHLGIKRRTDRQMASLNRLTQRGVSFPDAFAKTFVADKFGTATTHWSKLEERVERGVGNPCPLLLVGIPEGVIADV